MDETELDVDPYADDDGRIGTVFADEVGSASVAVLADPRSWAAPEPGLADRVLATIRSAGTDLDGRRIAGSAEPVDDPAADHAPETPVELDSRRPGPVRSGLLGAAAVVVALLAGIAIFSAFDDSDGGEVLALDLVPTGRIDDAGGSIEFETNASGLKITLDATGLPRRDDGAYYEGWVLLDDGRSVPVGTFHEGDGVVLWAGIDLDAVARFTITEEEAAASTDRSQAASGLVVLKVDVP